MGKVDNNKKSILANVVAKSKKILDSKAQGKVAGIGSVSSGEKAPLAPSIFNLAKNAQPNNPKKDAPMETVQPLQEEYVEGYDAALEEAQDYPKASILADKEEDIEIDIETTEDLWTSFGANSEQEFLTIIQDTDLESEYHRLVESGAGEAELNSFAFKVEHLLDEDEPLNPEGEDKKAITLEGENPDDSEESPSASIELMEKLNEKYNLNIDFNKDLTDDEITILQQAYIVEEQSKTIDSTEENMLKYFDSLGWIDNRYDDIKGFFGYELTEDNIRQYCANERLKNGFLTSVIQNGGQIPLDEESKETIASLAKYNLGSCETFEDIEQYAIKYLGFTEEDIKKYKDDNPLLYKDGKLSDVALDRVGEVQLKKHLINYIAENIDFEGKTSLSFEEVYKLTTGTEYNEEIISNVFASSETYALVAGQQQGAIYQEQMLANATPAQALAYFDLMAASSGEDITGEELFNNYYKDLFERYPDEFDFESIYGLSCTGISAKDGYLWQEIKFSDELSEEEKQTLAESHLLYKEIDKEGNEKYYKVINIEDSNIGITNIFSETGEVEEYQPLPIDFPTTFFEVTNETIKNKNLYLDATRQDYDEIYGEGTFDTVLEEFPKMYQEAFGKNVFLDKLNAYKGDMDSYTRNISQALSIGCFIAGFIPGCKVAWYVPIAIAASDNVMDGINIATCNLPKEEKIKLAKELGISTLAEAGMFVIGMGINKFANIHANRFVANRIANGNQFVMNHAAGVEALVEYGIDNIASVAWDTAKGIADGSLFNEDGSFNWDGYGKMVMGDMIFNTADLRNGMSFYKSLGDSAIDLGNGTKFEIDADSKVVKFSYGDGYTVEIKDGKAILKELNSTTHELSYNKTTNSWEMPDGTKIDISNGGTIPRCYTPIGNGMVEYTASNGTKMEVPEILIKNLLANGTDVDSALKIQHDLFDTSYVRQNDAVSCAAAATINAIKGKSGLEQALLNKFKLVDSATNEYKVNLFGQEYKFTLDGETNPLQKVYEAYQQANPDIPIDGDFPTRVMSDLFNDSGSVLTTLNVDTVDIVRSYAQDENSAMTVSLSEDIGELKSGHAYSLVEIDDNYNMILRDPLDPTTTYKLTPDQYEGKAIASGFTYKDNGFWDGTTEPSVAGIKDRFMNVVRNRRYGQEYSKYPSYTAQMDQYKVNGSTYPLYDRLTFAEFRYKKLQVKYSRDPRRFAFDSYSPADSLHGPWKMHIYASNEAERQIIMDTCGAYLTDNKVDWKVYTCTRDVSDLGGVQQGKVFTVYPRTQAEFAQIACDLEYIIRNNNLQTTGSSIAGDAPLGGSGRLFYRYEFTSRNCTDSRGHNALDSDFVLDLADSHDEDLYYNQYYDSNTNRQNYYDRNGVPQNGARHLAPDMTLDDDPWYGFDPYNPDNNPAIQRLKGQQGIQEATQAPQRYQQPQQEASYRVRFSQASKDVELKYAHDYPLETKLPQDTAFVVSPDTVLKIPAYKQNQGTSYIYIDFSNSYWKNVVSSLKEGQEITVGREGADINFGSQNIYMSSKHLVLKMINGRVVVLDTSTNGTLFAR